MGYSFVFYSGKPSNFYLMNCTLSVWQKEFAMLSYSHELMGGELCPSCLQSCGLRFRPHPWCYMGLFNPRCKNSHVPWLNLVKFLSAHFSGLPRALFWVPALISSPLAISLPKSTAIQKLSASKLHPGDQWRHSLMPALITGEYH